MTPLRRASFDVFDTLLERPFVRPSHLFTHVARRCPPTGLVAKLVPYRGLRMAAEFLTRCLHPGAEDITMAAIFRVLGWVVPNAQALQQAELDAEFRLCRPRPREIERFHDLEAAGCRPVVISDMYLPADFIQAMLAHHWLSPSAVYVSSQEGLRKGTGHLFERVCALEGVPPAAWVHVGDNPVSDQAQPRALGMQVIAVTPPHPGRVQPGLLGSVVAALAARQESPGPWRSLGAEAVGPMVLAYARFVAERVRVHQPARVFFLGRDGYLTKSCFERLCPGVSTGYLELSRRALLLPSFHDLDPNMEYLLFEGMALTVADFFRRIGVERPVDMADGPLNANRTRVSAWLHENKGTFLAQCATEREQLLAYLQRQGFEGEVLLVDLGWHGTIQKALETLAARNGIPVVMRGLFFGTGTCKVDQAESYFFDHHRPLSARALVGQSVALFEFLFTEPVASVNRVGCSGQELWVERVPPESPESLEARREIGRGAQHFLQAFLADFQVEDFTDGEYRAHIRAVLGEVLARPTPVFQASAGELLHSEGFGSSPQRRLVEPPLPGTSLHHLLRGYALSHWRSVYVERLSGAWRPLFRLGHRLLYSWPGQEAELILEWCVRRYMHRRSLKTHHRSLRNASPLP